MRCISPYVSGGVSYPCGQCRVCRADRASQWALRIMHEAESYKDTSFVTLTYSDEYIPEHKSLRRRDLQLFLKRLRKSIEPIKIKYYACGEYGDQTERPHYHMIILGLGIEAEEKISEAWGKGHITISIVNMFRCLYVTDYIQKKITGKKQKEYYGEREPPFQLQSQGMGLEYLKKNEDQIRELLYITQYGRKIGVPRYYKKKLAIKAEAYVDLEKVRRAEADERRKKGISLEDDKKRESALNKQKMEEIRTKDAMRPKGKL